MIFRSGSDCEAPSRRRNCNNTGSGSAPRALMTKRSNGCPSTVRIGFEDETSNNWRSPRTICSSVCFGQTRSPNGQSNRDNAVAAITELQTVSNKLTLITLIASSIARVDSRRSNAEVNSTPATAFVVCSINRCCNSGEPRRGLTPCSKNSTAVASRPRSFGNCRSRCRAKTTLDQAIRSGAIKLRQAETPTAIVIAPSNAVRNQRSSKCHSQSRNPATNSATINQTTTQLNPVTHNRRRI